MPLGLSADELQTEIERRIAALDSAQDDADNLGPFADLMRTTALIAFQRAAELILLNNARLAEQLGALE